MSGGGGKKRNTRTEGWEKADGEFYQERYPTDVDLEVLQRDPSHIATLLPSKQTRAGEIQFIVCQISFFRKRKSIIKLFKYSLYSSI